MLTKSDFLLYIESPRHLWAKKHGQLTQTELPGYMRHVIEQGYEVEKIAEQYVQQYLFPQYGPSPDGILKQVTARDKDFEARADLMLFNKEAGKWDLFEVKSSSGIDLKIRYDITFQTLIFEKVYQLGDKYILHLNPKYIRRGDLELEKLFTVRNVNQDIEDLRNDVLMKRGEALELIDSNSPEKAESCVKPRNCPCVTICHPKLPEYSIYEVTRLAGNRDALRKLESMGIYSIYDIPDNFELSGKQKIQIRAAKSGNVYVEKEAIRKLFNTLVYPIYFLDYEAYNPAIPIFEKYSPYDHMPFQYSLHVLEYGASEPVHHQYLEVSRVDPIPNLLVSLKNAIGESGSVVVWNRTFEAGINHKMARMYPEFTGFCHSLNRRLFDLMDIFKNQFYVDPKFRGSHSIKSVLPVIVPELNYKSLQIGDGAMAMSRWYEMVYGEGRGEKSDAIKEALLQYCNLDSYAMYMIWKKLVESIELEV